MSLVTLPRDRFNETSLHHFTSELSDLQLNGFPHTFIVDQLGNGNHFIPLKTERNRDNDIEAVLYMQLFGCVTVRIFND